MGKRACTRPGCGALVEAGQGRCPACKREAEQARGSAAQRGYGRKHRTQFREQVLARDPICKMCRKAWATVADHWPRDRRQLEDEGLDPNDPAYGRGLCASCHGKHTAKAQPGGWNERWQAVMVKPRCNLTLIVGPPCSGKTTYVREHMEPGDLVIDYDAIAQALGSPSTHDHPASLHPFILAARDALLDRMTRQHDAPRAWLIKCEPTRDDITNAATIVPVTASRDDCHARAELSQRPERWHGYIDEWFDRRKGGG